LRYTEHSNGHLLTILYATEEDWSKNFRDKTIDGAVTGHDRVVQRVSETFSDVEFAWMGNKDVPDDIFKGRGPAVAKLTIRPEPIPTSTSCCGAVRAESAPGALRLPRRSGLRFEGGEAAGILAGGVPSSHAYLSPQS
jgi:hypothetical protein